MLHKLHSAWMSILLPVCLVAFIAMLAPSQVFAQDPRPELLYFRFDEPGQMVTPNRANPATSVTAQGVLNGALTMGQTGQFGSALISSGGSATDIVTTGWSTSFGSGSWTISMWINNVNGSTFGYYFGDPSAGSFRCFNAGAAGTNNLTLRGGFTSVNVTGVNGGPHVIHFVKDAAANQIRAYKNGVLVTTVAQPVFSVQGTGGQFGVGAYSGGGGSGGFPAGALMDEFRIYNRALSDAEIAATWNTAVDCFFPAGVISYELLDANLQPTTYAQVPGSINLGYHVTYPDEESNVDVTVNFRDVITDAIKYTYSFSAFKSAGQPLDGIENISLPANAPTGYLKVEVKFVTKNSCLTYAEYTAESQTLLLLPPGAVMCIVWPGDTDNDGVVNYADRRALSTYIHEANMRSSWLEGPTRFSVIGGFDYIEWKAQPSAPWQTSGGCYMDTDGNGFINNFDYIAIKLNWMRTSDGSSPKPRPLFDGVSFDMDQNYPNPFNPSTSIRYAVPERSQVRLIVTDMLGREVATLVDHAVEAGVHSAMFDATGLSSGSYIATVRMTGLESGLTFAKTISMALSK